MVDTPSIPKPSFLLLADEKKPLILDEFDMMESPAIDS
jgi:hypothetical protein